MAYILVAALIRPKLAPAVPYEGKLLEKTFLRKVALALFPPLLLIFCSWVDNRWYCNC